MSVVVQVTGVISLEDFDTQPLQAIKEEKLHVLYEELHNKSNPYATSLTMPYFKRWFEKTLSKQMIGLTICSP